MRRKAIILSALFCALVAMSLGQRQGVGQAKAEKPSRSEKQVQSGSLTTHAPEGITREQADAILNELKQIRQLLEKQNAQIPAGTQPSQEASIDIRSDWYSLGRDDAPLTLVEFVDYECPFCRRFQADTFEQLKKAYIDTGKVRFITRDLPLDFHASAFKAAEAARCAGEQGKFWEMREALIAHANDLSQSAILKYATALALDSARFGSCVTLEKHKTEVLADLADASKLEISGTPTFVLGKTSGKTLNGAVIVGAQPYSTFESSIEHLLATRP